MLEKNVPPLCPSSLVTGGEIPSLSRQSKFVLIVQGV